MTRRSSALCGLTLVLALGCASQPEEARSEAAPSSEREYEEPSDEQVAGGEPAAAPTEDGEAPPSFAEIQRQLAANNQKLRELGVELPGQGPIGAAGPGNAEGGDGTKAATQPAEKSGGGTTGSVAPAPGAQPNKSTKGDAADKKAPRRDKPASKPEAKAKAKDEGASDETLDDRSAGAEQAKSAPLIPNDGDRNQDAVGECQQICDLAAISCGLGDQICELAERHPEEEDYVSACERANADCDAAQEACHACE